MDFCNLPLSDVRPVWQICSTLDSWNQDYDDIGKCPFAYKGNYRLQFLLQNAFCGRAGISSKLS